jgi:hypothetical protein
MGDDPVNLGLSVCYTFFHGSEKNGGLLETSPMAIGLESHPLHLHVEKTWLCFG